MQEFIEGSLDVTVSPTRVPFTDVSNKKPSEQSAKRSSNSGKHSQTKKPKKSDGPTGQVLFVSEHGGDCNARLDPIQPLMTEASSNKDQQIKEASPPPLDDIYWTEWDTREEEIVTQNDFQRSQNDFQQLLNDLITGVKLVKGQEVLMSQQKELLLRVKGIEESLQSNPLPTMHKNMETAIRPEHSTSNSMETARRPEHSTPNSMETARRTENSTTNSMAHIPSNSSICGVGGVDGQPPNNWLLTIPPAKNELKDNITEEGLMTVEEASWKYKSMLVEHKFSAVAVKLAREVYFGDEVLKKCTPRGHGDLPALPHQMLNTLKSTLYEWYPKYWGNPK